MNFARYPNYSFLQTTTNAIKLVYAHTTVVGVLARDPRDPSRVVPMISFQNYSQSVGSIRSDNSGIYNATSVVGLDQLFRPYTMDQNQGYAAISGHFGGSGIFIGSGLIYLPVYKIPSSLVTYSGSTSITSASLNPFPSLSGESLHDCEWMSSGSSYSGLHVHKKWDDLSYAGRGIALKSPLILEGWGFNIAGNPVPHASGDSVNFQVQSGPLFSYSSGNYPSGIVKGYNTSDSGNVFADHAFEDSTKWAVGPLNARWNPINATWGFTSMVKGKLVTTIPANTGVAYMDIWINNKSTGNQIMVGNWYSSAVLAGTKIQATWDDLESFFYISSADCS